ncbi:MAG: hypothetical protein H6510_12540 [Acidobacteria bacterium]|nr:hypothetical protein [Acidobacteriota bacterium]MCB9398634.1 hypothetical protein [Acidobacteriota bacterium]
MLAWVKRSCSSSSESLHFMFLVPFIGGTHAETAKDFGFLFGVLQLLAISFWMSGWGAPKRWMERAFLFSWPAFWLLSHFLVWGFKPDAGPWGWLILGFGFVFYAIATRLRFRRTALELPEVCGRTQMGVMIAFFAIALATSQMQQIQLSLIAIALALGFFFRERARI